MSLNLTISHLLHIVTTDRRKLKPYEINIISTDVTFLTDCIKIGYSVQLIRFNTKSIVFQKAYFFPGERKAG